MSKGSVLIIGGGIGGLSTAIAVQLAGFDATVLEKHDDLHSSVNGVGIIQPINALRALDAIGCAQACIDAGYPAKAWGSMYDVDGNFVREMPGAKIEGSNLPPMNGLTRPKLHQILTERALETGVDIRYSTTATAVHQDAHGAWADLTGGSTERFDMLVGADGVRSAVRPAVLDTDVQPSYIGQSAFRVNIPLLPGIDRIILQAGPEGMAGFVPIGPDLAYMFYNAQVDRSYRPAHERLADVLREHLAPFGGLSATVRDNYLTDPDAVVLRPEEAMIAPAPWHRAGSC